MRVLNNMNPLSDGTFRKMPDQFICMFIAVALGMTGQKADVVISYCAADADFVNTFKGEYTYTYRLIGYFRPSAFVGTHMPVYFSADLVWL